MLWLATSQQKQKRKCSKPHSNATMILSSQRSTLELIQIAHGYIGIIDRGNYWDIAIAVKHLNTADGETVVAEDVDAIPLLALVPILNVESEDFLPPFGHSSSKPGPSCIQKNWELYTKLA